MLLPSQAGFAELAAAARARLAAERLGQKAVCGAHGLVLLVQLVLVALYFAWWVFRLFVVFAFCFRVCGGGCACG